MNELDVILLAPCFVRVLAYFSLIIPLFMDQARVPRHIIFQERRGLKINKILLILKIIMPARASASAALALQLRACHGLTLAYKMCCICTRHLQSYCQSVCTYVSDVPLLFVKFVHFIEDEKKKMFFIYFCFFEVTWRNQVHHLSVKRIVWVRIGKKCVPDAKIGFLVPR